MRGAECGVRNRRQETAIPTSGQMFTMNKRPLSTRFCHLGKKSLLTYAMMLRMNSRKGRKGREGLEKFSAVGAETTGLLQDYGTTTHCGLRDYGGNFEH